MTGRRYLAAVGVVFVCATTGCGDSTESGPARSSVAATIASDTVVLPDGLVIEVTIANGSIAPTNERIEAVVGEPVTVRIDSDTRDELHVHSVPDHTFDVVARQGQTFEFVVDVPGQVALELHDSGRTIATLLVRP